MKYTIENFPDSNIPKERELIFSLEAANDLNGIFLLARTPDMINPCVLLRINACGFTLAGSVPPSLGIALARYGQIKEIN